MAAHIYVRPQGRIMGCEWNSWVISLVWQLLASQSSTRRLAMDFECFCRRLLSYTYLTYWLFVCQYWVMTETTIKQWAFYCVQLSTFRIPGLIYLGAIFSTVNTSILHTTGFRQPVAALQRSWHCHVKTVPQVPFSNAMECGRDVGEGTSFCNFIHTANLMSAWTDPRMHNMLPFVANLSFLQLEYPCCYRCLMVHSVWDWSHI